MKTLATNNGYRLVLCGDGTPGAVTGEIVSRAAVVQFTELDRAAEAAYRIRDAQMMDELCDLRFRPKRTWVRKWTTDAGFRSQRLRIAVPSWLGVLLAILGLAQSGHSLTR